MEQLTLEVNQEQVIEKSLTVIKQIRDLSDFSKRHFGIEHDISMLSRPKGTNINECLNVLGELLAMRENIYEVLVQESLNFQNRFEKYGQQVDDFVLPTFSSATNQIK